MHGILRLLGKDSVMFMSAAEFPLPYEYRHLPTEDVVHELPADADERTIVFLDCGNIDRMPVNFLQRDEAHILNIDHHHDNTHFGTANLVVGNASCTAEILYSLTKDLELELTPEIAEALYVALVTDTGRFQYTNTTAESHRMAAELMRAGRGRARRVPPPLRERAGRQGRAARPRAEPGRSDYDGGRLTISFIEPPGLRAVRGGREPVGGHRRPRPGDRGDDRRGSGARPAEGRAGGNPQGQPALGRRRRSTSA